MPEKIYEITIHALYPEATSTEILLIVAAHIAKGGSADVIGREIKELKAIKSIQPNISADSNSIFGSIIYIDHFGNCISNINQQLIKDVAKGRDFYVSFGTKKLHEYIEPILILRLLKKVDCVIMKVMFGFI